MEHSSDGMVHRSLSRTSTSSSKSHKTGTVRVRPRKKSSAVSTAQTTPTTATTDKSLTSFPSLSPENSPRLTHDGNFHANVSTQTTLQTPPKSARHKPSIVDSLVANTPSFRGRSSLFEDSPPGATQHVPGALHHASDDAIRRLAAKTGVVVLIRQLAEDVAQRDVEMTTLRRRAEERERELKRMLREVEVSNLDIETRLHHLDNPVQTAGNGPRKGETLKQLPRCPGATKVPVASNEIHEMVGEAMMDDVGINTGVDENCLDSVDKPNGQATIKRSRLVRRDSDERSTVSSIDSYDNSNATVKGWKDYLWSNTGTSRKSSRASSAISDNGKEIKTVTRARATSGAASRRKGLSDDLFKPPHRRSTTHERNILYSTETEGSSKSNRSRTSSMSVASWTLKLFAGNSQAGRETENQDTIRGRSFTNGNLTSRSIRNPSKSSTQTASSARAALLRVSSRTGMNQVPKKPIQSLAVGPNGTFKGLSSQSTQSLPPASPASIDTMSTNLGPVEMDTILPHGSRPPTLTPSFQNIDDASDYLTDRFGFIYDQRRRKKEAESFVNLAREKSTSNVEMLSNARDTTESLDPGVQATDENKPQDVRPDTPASTNDQPVEKSTKRWQDYLKVTTVRTELLSHTPSSGATVTNANGDIKNSLKRSPTFGDNGENRPSPSPTPKPSASSITAENAEISKPFAATATSFSTPVQTDAEPVKILLAQLTELHDNLQREKEVRWNEFMRKIRAERGKQRELASNLDARSQKAIMPEMSLTDGEIIGIATLGSKGKVGRAKYKEFKSLVLAGIPVAHRAKVWAECSGASGLRIPGYYDDLITNGVDDPVILAQIQMDINRTLTDNVFFRKGPGVAKLNEVLLAYSRRNPEVGYCQGMNLITASLLLIMPTAEDAFWVLVSMIENILPRHYYDNSLLTSRADQQVLRQYVSELLPRLSAHLDSLGIELEALTFQWFLSLFTDCLSAEALYRVWDVLLCCKDEDGNGGSTFLFQVALALLKLNEGQLVACETPGEVYAYLGGEITNHAISIDGLIRASDGLKKVVRRSEVEERRATWVEFERETVREREKIRREGIGRKVAAGRESRSAGSESEADGRESSGDVEGYGQLQVQPPMPVED
ncbi:MAG: hypothetical protein Q9187_002491 [Circinaria calcarea]